MIKTLEYIFLFVIFPGFLFSGAMGLLIGWLDRKITARIQWRVGPPWYQNFFDILKLSLYKETLLPEGVSSVFFLGMPLIGLAAATLVSTMIFVINGAPKFSFIGDIIAVVYLMLIPSISLMLGAFASKNSLASLGGAREMKLMLSYELPFILCLVVTIMKSGFNIRLGEMMLYQNEHGWAIASISGIISFIVMILCAQAKLGFIPFDMPEAETEIMGGTYIEYSGKALAAFKLTKAIMYFALPMFIVTIYFGGLKDTVEGFISTVLAYLLVVVLMVLIKNTNPRVRIDHAVRFFWGPMTSLAVLSIVLAYLGY